ncbi:MAG: hypothetical protein JSU70_07925 [Phycisphaerales bacterium]|nr:MAG: hypothetical protein JSU70_07925 [Phycisphaerales bacterium]
MKKYLITVSLALGVLVVAWTAFGQEEGGSARRRGGGPGQNVSAEERAKMRERFQNMSEEEREKFRAQMRERFGSRRPPMGREDQLKSIKAIEEQLAKMKKDIEAGGPEDRTSFQDMSEEERSKLRERFAKVRAEREKATQAIMAELAKLQGRRPPAEGERLLLISSGDLKPIQELAVKEKAKETAQRLERLMAGRGRMRFGPRQPGAAPRAR